MSPSRGEKRKRSPSPSRSKSPDARSKSPEAKKGKLGKLLSFLTPSKSKEVEEKKKKRLSFGAPVVHAFDAFSPPCRRRPLHDNATLDAGDMDKGLVLTTLSLVSRPVAGCRGKRGVGRVYLRQTGCCP